MTKETKETKPAKKATVRFCPQCNGKDVEINMSTGIIFGMPQMWRCNDCGYQGYVFPEMDLEEESKKEKNKNKIIK